MNINIKELIYATVAHAAKAAAFSCFEEARRGGVGRGIDDVEPDDLDCARDRLGGPHWKLEAFFGHLKTEDLHALVAVYYAHRDSDGERREPDFDAKKSLQDCIKRTTRKGSERATREACIRKLTEVSASNLVSELVGGLRVFGRAAEELRNEFSKF